MAENAASKLPADAKHANAELVSSQDIERIEAVANFGSGFKSIRQSAFARTLALPFVTGSDESWRYTKPEKFDWKKLLNTTPVSVELGLLDKNGGAALPPEVKIVTGEAASQSKLLASVLGDRSSDLHGDPVAALQVATATTLTVITVSKNAQLSQPLLLSQILPAGLVAASSIVLISVEAGARATIVEDLQGGEKSFLAPRLEVVVADNAEFTFCSVQDLARDAVYLARHRFYVGRDAELHTAHVALGAKTARLDLDLRLELPGSTSNMLAMYFADGSRHIDIHPTQSHLAPHCRSDFFSKGVITDRARSVYYGYIKVAEGAQKTDAYQTNRNLLLSEHGRADSIPNLGIQANDVRCSHGASVSHVNSEDMFYLMTRGLSRSSAEQVLVEGFLEDLLTRVSTPRLHDFLSMRVMERLQPIQ